MKEIFIWILSIAYGGGGIITAIAYWPTIKDLYYHKKPSANILSYILWTGTSGIALLYALFILPDLLFILVSAMNFVACGAVLFLSIRLRQNPNTNLHKSSTNS